MNSYIRRPAKLPLLHAARQAAATSSFTLARQAAAALRCPPSCGCITLARRVAATSRCPSSCSYVTLPNTLHLHQHAATPRCPLSSYRHFTLPLPLATATSSCCGSCCSYFNTPHLQAVATQDATATSSRRYVTLPFKSPLRQAATTSRCHSNCR